MRKLPRQSFSIRGYLPNDEFRRIENLIYGWRKRIWAIPIWTDARPATQSVLGGDTIVYVDTRFADFRVNSLGLVWKNAREFAMFQITEITDTTLTANRPISGDYSNPMIMPIRSALMTRDPIRDTSGYDGYIDADFEVTDNGDIPSSPSDLQFLGEDVFIVEHLSPDGGFSVKDKYTHRIDKIDFQTGPVQYAAPWDDTRISREIELKFEGAEELWNFKKWLYRRAGQLRPFYMTTSENNFVIISTGTIGDSFVAKPNDYQRQSLPRNHIAFLLKSGAVELRTVIASDTDLDGNTTVTFTPELGLAPELIDEVSFIGLKRLASDKISIKHLQNEVALIKLPIMEIRP